MGTFFGRQPAAISAFISAVLKCLVLFGVIVLTVEQAVGLILVVDLGLALLVWQNVTPTAAPKLTIGTPVLLDNPPGTPADAPPPNGVVALRNP